MISKQAVLDVLKNYGLDDLDTAYLTAQINSLPSISEDSFKRDIIFKLSMALSDYFNDDELSLIKQCLNKLIPVPKALDAAISSAVATACLCYVFEKKERLVIKEVKK